MNILDVYAGKDGNGYICNKCQANVYYGKVARDDGTLYTIDGQPPNGKFGKESNVLSAQVDANVQDRIHECALEYINKKIKELDSGVVKTTGSQTKLIDVKVPQIQYPEGTTPREQISGTQYLVMECIRQGEEITRRLYPKLDENTTVFAQIRNTMADKVLQAFSAKCILEELAKVKEAINDS